MISPQHELFLLLVSAPFVGSFVGVVADRMPLRQQFVWGRSACGSCHRQLRPAELIPIVSWFLLKGRCGECGNPIAVRYLVVELLALGVVAWAALVLPAQLLLPSAVLGFSLLCLSLIDLKHFFLPDMITLPLALIGIGFSVIIPEFSIILHIVGSLVGFASIAGVRVAYLYYSGREGIGLGDAKLMAAAGAWLGWPALPGVVLIGAVLALVAVLISGGRVRSGLEKKIAFGPFLCAGIWLCWLYGTVTFG